MLYIQKSDKMYYNNYDGRKVYKGVEKVAEKLEVYQECYAYQGRRVTLRKIEISDAEDLLRCYAEFETLEKMQEEIQLWLNSYDKEELVCWSIVLNETQRTIGTVKMSGIEKRGFLKLDLERRYEEDKMLRDVLRIVDNFFYDLFEVTEIVTRCEEENEVRKGALSQSGYKVLNEAVNGFDDNYIRYY